MKMEYKKKIFQILYEEIGANAKVHRYYDREGKAKIDIYFASPFLWEGIQGHELNNHAVAWLLVIPISDAEFDYLRYNGDEAFEELLEQSEVDFSDIYRNSVI